MNNFVDWLFEKTKNKEKMALSSNASTINYNDLYAKIINMSQIISNSFGEDNNIILISENSLFFVVSYLSIIGSGNVCVPLKYDKNLDLKKIKDKTNSKIIFIQKKYHALLKNLEFENIFMDKDLPKGQIPDKVFKEFDKNKLAAIMFTSGSTGDPKGVMISHKNLISNTDSIIDGLSLSETDKILAVLPFYYGFGASLLHTHLRVGGGIILNNNFFSPQKIIDNLEINECTGIAGVPTTFQILLRRTKIKETKFKHMRCVQQAGGKLADPYLKELINIFGQEKIFVMYGQTEATTRLSILNPNYLKTKFGSIGKGIKGVELKIINSKGEISKEGEIGEICAKGENIMQGYYKDEKETKNKIVKGMLKTGDIARSDNEGFLYIVDRKEDFIKSGGYRISGKLVENVISSIPSVVEVAVVGVKDDLLGEKIVAYVSTNENINAREIMNYCLGKLQKQDLPKEIIILSSLPRNQSLKVDSIKLKNDYETLKKIQTKK